ncbi:HAMP domain-containing sensor histidine kinase [Bacillaceae bacterium IKA-2]|nr:HAMP domain-containing sensor histidine kinase [Bacillaceae bacterium IKA-2]
MPIYLDTLLLNLLFLIVLLLFIPYLIETELKVFSEKYKYFIMLIATLLAAISCIAFSFEISEGIKMDLRAVPFIVGGLYLGKRASVIIIGGTLAFHYFLGGFGIGFNIAVIIGIITLICLFILHNTFNKTTKKKKIIIGCNLSLFISIIVLFVFAFIFNQSVSLYFATAFSTLYVASTFLLIYFTEQSREISFIKRRILKVEKLEIISQLASSISHEVRNPLTVVKGFLQLLAQNDISENKRKEFINYSLEEINRANDIIGNYLTFAKPNPETTVNIDLKQELQQAINIITPMANMNCVEINTRIDRCYIKGEPQLLQQALLNITKNCIEAMPSGGSLFIETKEMNSEIMIAITDTGKGMTEEQLYRLGEPYYTSKGLEGTGLGMMAAIQIIEMMNGKLVVTSHLNEGTQFKIHFPKNFK